MSNKVKWICQTGLLTALLIVLQFATKPLGQIVTGSCVNAVLAVSVLVAGFGSGLTVAVLSPFFAFMLGIGPQLIAIIPAIAAGNCVLVIVLHYLFKLQSSPMQRIAACAASSFAKFITLNIIIVQILCRVLELGEKQIATFSAMFSWPQLITAFIGTGLASIIYPRIKSSLK